MASDRAAKIDLIRTDSGKIEVVKEPKATIKSITDTKINLEIIKDNKATISAVVCGIAGMPTTTSISISTSSSSTTSSSSVSISTSSISTTTILEPVDYYSETNNGENPEYLGDVWETQLGQSFTTTNNSTLKSCKFYLAKVGLPTGNMVATLYDITGTFGTDSTPTGLVLATSNILDVSTLTEDFQLITFTFSGINQYSMLALTNYFIIGEYYGGDSDNNVLMGTDDTLPTHPGNSAYKDSGIPWTNGTNDLIFYVYN